jgi:catechol 2,3-dioxygenase-like lactoylglutathione lyase family enzyme
MKYMGMLITVEDIDRSRKFYEEIMEQKIVNAPSDVYIVFDGSLSIMLKSFFKKLLDNKEIYSGGNSFELYFEHNNLEQFEKK